MPKTKQTNHILSITAANAKALAVETKGAIDTQASQLTQVKAAFMGIIASIVRSICKGLPEGKRTVSTYDAKIYQSNRALYIAALRTVFTSKGGFDEKAFKSAQNAIDYQIKSIYGGAPMSETEKDNADSVKAKALEAQRKALQRAKIAAKKELGKDAEPEAILERAKAALAEKRAANNDAAKMERANARAVVTLQDLSKAANDGLLGDGDARPFMQQCAALIITLKALA